MLFYFPLVKLEVLAGFLERYYGKKNHVDENVRKWNIARNHFVLPYAQHLLHTFTHPR